MVSYVRSFGGLRVLPYRPSEKTTQFFSLRRDIILFREPSRVIFMGLSNDFENLIVQGGELLRLASNAITRWGGLSDEGRATFNHHNCRLLHNRSLRYLKGRLSIYIQQLETLFSDSTAEVIYHVSVLERLMPLRYPNLPMFWAVLNSMLFSALKKATITNRYGKVIRFKFVRVGDLFFLNPNPESLFPRREINRRVMVHRTDAAYRDIYERIHETVMRDVGLD